VTLNKRSKNEKQAKKEKEERKKELFSSNSSEVGIFKCGSRKEKYLGCVTI
jgi:hypothetical protein